MDSSSSPSGDMLTCSRPMIERRLRPPHDLALKCPRCESTHTKFCYYNNYSLSQPRYFCKTCRRYWTKGGTLRNIPVGGGCRKNKKVSAKKSNNDHQLVNNNNSPTQPPPSSSYHHHSHPKDLQLSSFPDVQFSHLSNLLGTNIANPSFMEGKYGIGMIENPRPIDFMMESKLEGIIGSGSSSRNNFDFFGNSDMSMGMTSVGLGDMNSTQNGLPPNFHHHGLSAFGGMSMSMSLDHGNNNNNSGGNGGSNNYLMDSCQRLMLPLYGNFSVASSYLRNYNHNEPTDVVSKMIWRWPGLERIKCFFGKVGKKFWSLTTSGGPGAWQRPTNALYVQMIGSP
ncbi:hypothetical protein JHK85_016018 [Glycine max]|nr:hypothetical protein JHK85_016018 [Glycine max]